MADTICISGTDPTNPRRAAHIVERLEQISRDLGAMHEESGRLMVFAGRIRDVLMDQGQTFDRALGRTQEITSAVRKLREELSTAARTASLASDAIAASKVDLRADFTWRPAGRSH